MMRLNRTPPPLPDLDTLPLLLDRVTPLHRRVVATWSGGIDSTGVLAHLLVRGYDVTAVTLELYGGQFHAREQEARTHLLPHLKRVAELSGGTLQRIVVHDTSFLWQFGPDGVEIPHRNKRILDYLCDRVARRVGTTNVALGEYIGTDTWLVRDHVSGADADARALAAYLFLEYGPDWRLFTLADFGESRFKADRLRLLCRVLDGAAVLTTNCLYESREHCGECYKCQERAAAFHVAGIPDLTHYTADPRQGALYPVYVAQQQGRVPLDADAVAYALVASPVDVARLPRPFATAVGTPDSALTFTAR